MMIRVLSIARREAGAGEMVRDGVLAEWRLVWVNRGVGEYRSRGKAWDVGPGWVVLRGKGCRDVFWWESSSDARWVEVGFEWEGCVEEKKTRSAARRGETVGAIAREVKGGDAVGPMIAWIWSHREAIQSAGMGKMMEAILEVMVSGEMGTAQPPTVVLPGVVEKAVAWMRSRLAENVGVIFTNEEIAAAAGCSVPWLQVLFKRHLGWYPVQMARRARLDRAVELLKETEWPVAAVAETCGFVSPSHLSRQLRMHMGMDASTVRRRARVGELACVRLAEGMGRLVSC